MYLTIQEIVLGKNNILNNLIHRYKEDQYTWRFDNWFWYKSKQESRIAKITWNQVKWLIKILRISVHLMIKGKALKKIWLFMEIYRPLKHGSIVLGSGLI